jgi:hypothetical protein
VTPELVEILAKYMIPLTAGSSSNENENDSNLNNHHSIDNATTAAAIVFLQSDIENVLQDMQQVFEEETCSASRYFTKLWNHTSYTADDNLLHVPTEREASVLKQGLPVYRTLFVRNSVPYDAKTTVE